MTDVGAHTASTTESDASPAGSDTASGAPRLHVDGAVARITLARPEHRNRIHYEDLVTLHDYLASLDADLDIRAVVLAAEVLERRPVFSAGAHIGQFDSGKPEITLEQLMLELEDLRPVTICALNGSVYGGASDFPLACDLAIGAEGIQMRVPAAAIGLHYHGSGLTRYVSRIGVAATKMAFLTATSLDAETLLRVGFVQELVPSEQVLPRAEELARHVAGLAPLAVASMKASLNEIARGQADPGTLDARMDQLMQTEDFVEGRRAFAERRAPNWKGR